MNKHASVSNQMQFQHGQAMVEYAILFIVLSILFIGGAELGMAALASYKNTDAAKTGISEYAEVNQRRLNILNAEKQYLITLSGFNCSVIYRIRNSYDSNVASYLQIAEEGPPIVDGPSISDSSRALLEADEFDFTCTRPNQTLLDNGIKLESPSANFVDFLDNLYAGNISDFSSFDDVANYLFEISDASQEPNSPSGILLSLDINNNGILTTDELMAGETRLKESFVPNDNKLEGQLKYKALLLIEHNKLSLLPLSEDSNTFLSQAKIEIGNHASSNFSQPRCEGNEYIYGFPDNDGDGIEDRFIAERLSGNEIYLFNPLPIDIDSCQGSDDTRGGRSRISILVGGYSDLTDPTKYEPGLPKLNQAMYGMYKKNKTNDKLIPPGKICTSEDDCPNQPNESLYVDDVGPSGYYRWNKGSDGTGAGDLFQYTINNVSDDLQNGFRPSMQIDCSPTPNPEGQVSGINGYINDPNCQSGYSKVRLHTRYRKIFEGFLTFGLQKLIAPNDSLEAALDLFYNPDNVGVSGSNQVNGTIDSEIGPLVKENGVQYPTIKRRKDFRGCYEVDVETNQISACN